MNALSVFFNDKDKQGQFATALAHEARNPLANIGLSVDMLLAMSRDGTLTPYLDIIKRNALRINKLIIDLLSDSYANDVQVEEYPVNKLLDEVLDYLDDRIKLKNIVVSKNYSGDGNTIFVNIARMKIALTNIIVNAIEAMPPAEGVLSLVTKGVYGKYIIEIKDNGCGISKHLLDQMFKVSFTNKPGGLGLGLPIIHDVLCLNRVDVNVESEEGKGTCFTLLFDKNKHAEN